MGTTEDIDREIKIFHAGSGIRRAKRRAAQAAEDRQADVELRDFASRPAAVKGFVRPETIAAAVAAKLQPLKAAVESEVVARLQSAIANHAK